MSLRINGPAAALSFLIPGLGQLWYGHVLRGIAWFVLVVCGYACFVVPGICFHFICVLAASGCDAN